MDIRTVRPATMRMRTAAIATAALLIALFALPQTAFGMQIFAKTPNSKHITIEVEPTDRTEDVREKISEKEGYASDAFYLVFAGKLLEDGLTLQDYSIQKDAILHIVLKPTLELRVADDADLTDGLDAGELVLTAVTPSGGAEALTDQATYSFRPDGAADVSWEPGLPTASGTYEMRALVPVALATSDGGAPQVIERLEVRTQVTIPDPAEEPGTGGGSGSTEPGTGSEGSGGSGSTDAGAGSGTPGSGAEGSSEAPESGNGQAGAERDDADAGRAGAPAAQLPATGDNIPTVLIVLIAVAAVAIVAGIVLRSRKR